ncbi:DNA glycosylase [Phanerochaete sordida]|uniref:Adenine DNA glycosylase n=1 Tax=Phanerochaete sordida TaxID=48140 RepID=A0A9P3GHK3_9APHY|nr:DNA glycosylase [Phanerochaete sordida]
MAKRTRAGDDDESEYEVDGESDASFTPSSKRARTKSAAPRKKQPMKKAQKSQRHVPDVNEQDDIEVHPVSRHIIADAAPMQSALLEWYAGVHEARGMPWRKPYDPTLGPDDRAQRAYEVWVSEIMLQQTQVATVIPYYTRWMQKFPTVRDLAAADIDTVNAHWKGLGYYSRAARLLQGAQKVVAELGGRLPGTAQDMEAQIPGIGRYSAGAICSIAYNERVPVLDGNVKRLMARLLALHAPPTAKQSLDVLWAGATAMVQGSARPGDVNQALIELGATVCKVQNPSCGPCPLQAWCGAHQQQHAPAPAASDAPRGGVPDIEELCTLCAPLPRGSPVTAFPPKAPRKQPRAELDVVSVVEWRHPRTHARHFLLVRRSDTGLLAGLHEFPTQPAVSPDLALAEQHALPQKLLADILATPPRAGPPPHADADTDAPLTIAQITPAGDVPHVFSHIRKTYRVQWVLLAGGGVHPPALAPAQGPRAAGAPPRALWARLADVPDANIGTGVLKVWRQVCALW